MATYYGYNNVKFTVANQSILVDSVSFSLGSRITEKRQIEEKGGFDFVTESGAEGSLSLSYYLEGADPLLPYINNNEFLAFDAAGLTQSKAYLTSYSISVTPFNPAKANVNLSIYEDFGGSFTPATLENEERVYLKFSDMDVSFQGINATANITSLNYSISKNVEPNYLADGTLVPSKLILKEINTNLSMESYGFTEALPYNGKTVLTDFSIGPNKYHANGIMEAKDIGFAFAEKIKATLSVKSNSYGKAPSLRESNTGGVKNVGDYWHIYGNNLIDTTAVYFNNNVKANEFTTYARSPSSPYDYDSEIKVKIPRFALSGPIKVFTPYGEATHQQRSGGASIIANINSTFIP